MQELKPHIIDFQEAGTDEVGLLAIAEVSKQVPFPIQRVYWVYDTPSHVTRGGHANRVNQQIVICVSGSVKVTLQSQEGELFHFEITSREHGVFLPPHYWRTFELSSDAILVCLASEPFREEDYIRDFDTFLHANYAHESTLK